MSIFSENILDFEFDDCEQAAKDLASRFDDREWFKETYAETIDKVHVIYLIHSGRCPEKHRLYTFKGFPVLMRNAVDKVSVPNEEDCRKERKTTRK